jgi:Outer membrane protein beta-barrel domain
MRNRSVRSLALGAMLMASPVLAQRTAPTVARLTPYVGYITFGSIADGPIGTRVSNSSSALYGIALGLDVMPHVSLVGNLGYTDSNVKVGLPIIGGISIADSKILLYDAGLQFRLPTVSSLGTGIAPFIEGGAGAMRYEVRSGPLTSRATNFAVNYGGGFDLQLNRALGLRLQAKDYVGKFDLKEATSLNIDTKVAHNWAFNVGLNLGF